MRGLLATPGVYVVSKDGLRSGTEDDAQYLRAMVLFWDKVVSAEPGQFRIGGGPELEYLENVGFFERRPFPQPGGGMAQLQIDARSQAFEKLEAASPGSWAIFSHTGHWDGEEADSQRALRVRLMGALPVPNQDVPLAEVLEFKQKRQAERDALMAHIDDVYQSVRAAFDRPLAEHTAMQKLAAGAKNQLDVMREAGLPFRLADIAGDFNIAAATAAALGSVALGATWPEVLRNSLVSGGSVSISKLVGIVNPKKADTPFRYVLDYHQEVFRPE